MTPEQLHELMRNASNVKALELLKITHHSDHVFFERLVNFFSSCQFDHNPLSKLRREPAED